MSLKSFGAELRRRREEKMVTLMDICAATRINVKFLQAIEEGEFTSLPRPYVRAFLREYAQSIGMPVDQIMAGYESAANPKLGEKQEGRAEPHERKHTAVALEPQRSEQAPFKRHAAMITVGVAAVLLALYVINTATTSNSVTEPVTEVPFDNVVKESEATLLKPEAVSSPVIPIKTPEPDSLRLEIVTHDSVWISIVIDGKRTEEYLIPPNWRKSWAAKDQYSVTMGNAGGATFHLNGSEIPPLGRRGAVVRNIVLNEETLRKL